MIRVLEVVEESLREVLRSRNTDIRAFQGASAKPDGSEWISASNKPFLERLDALESWSLPLDCYAIAKCPELSRNASAER